MTNSRTDDEHIRTTNRSRRLNQNGQAMGAKGLKTRLRLTEATSRLLGRMPLRELRVTDIARAAATSPATFYLYFEDVTDAVLAVIEELSQSTPRILAIVQEPWEPSRALEHAQILVGAYVEHWDTHRAVYRVRNLAADEGDARFLAARQNSAGPLLEALGEQIQMSGDAGLLPAGIEPISAAGAIVALLERVAAVARTANHKRATYGGLLYASAYMIATMMVGNIVAPKASGSLQRQDI